METPLDEVVRRRLARLGLERVQRLSALRASEVAKALQGAPVTGRVRYELKQLSKRIYG